MPVGARTISLAALIVLALTGCGPSDEEGLYRARKAELERRNRGLRELIAEAEQGSLLPPDRFMVGVDETLTSELFHTQLPLERVVKRFLLLRLESATIRFREKYGTVRIESRVGVRGLPFDGVALRIQGGLGAADVDPDTGVLRVRIAIDHVALVEAGGLEGWLGRGAMNFLGSGIKDVLEEALPPLEVPVRLEQAVPVPALSEGGVQLAALRVPLEVSVERVLAAGGKLWVIFDAAVGPVEGGEQGVEVDIELPPKPKPQAALPHSLEALPHNRQAGGASS